jgi:hypothetical protein
MHTHDNCADKDWAETERLLGGVELWLRLSSPMAKMMPITSFKTQALFSCAFSLL